jgi:S-adenosylmethionine/arginine decarboxylase-like enzyme
VKTFGKELILDLHDCDTSLFTKEAIERYFVGLGKVTDMELQKLCWWDDWPEEWRKVPHLCGLSAVQFISTSNFTIHTLDLLGAVYLNIFTCKDFDPRKAEDFTAKFFKGRVVNSHVVDRL